MGHATRGCSGTRPCEQLRDLELDAEERTLSFEQKDGGQSQQLAAANRKRSETIALAATSEYELNISSGPAGLENVGQLSAKAKLRVWLVGHFKS